MKHTLLSFAFVLMIITANAQGPTLTHLSPLKKGKYVCDTVYKHFDRWYGTGRGMIRLIQLNPIIVTGVRFYMIADSIEKSAFIDSMGISIPVHKGVKYPLPLKIAVTGKIRLCCIVEGTPEVSGQGYPCDLQVGIPLPEDGFDWDPQISPYGNKQCIVESADGIEDNDFRQLVYVYPNPAENEIAIHIKTSLFYTEFEVFNAMGAKVWSGKLEREFTTLPLAKLPAGNYFIRIDGKWDQTLRFIKK